MSARNKEFFPIKIARYELELDISSSNGAYLITCFGVVKDSPSKFQNNLDDNKAAIYCSGMKAENMVKMLIAGQKKQHPSVTLQSVFANYPNDDTNVPSNLDVQDDFTNGCSLVFTIEYHPDFEEPKKFYIPLRLAEVGVTDLVKYNLFSHNSNNNQEQQDTSKEVAQLKKEIDGLRAELKKVSGDLGYYQSNANRISALEKKSSAPSFSAPKLRWVKLANGTGNGSGAYWTWNTFSSTDNALFSRTTTDSTNDTLVITEAGIYEVFIRTAATTSANYYMALYVNGNDIARSYSASSGNHHQSFHMHEIFDFTANAKLQVYQQYSNASLNGDPHNSFTVRKLD